MRFPQLAGSGRRAVVVAAAATLTMGLGASAVAAPNGQHHVSHEGPVINANFPDPDTLRVGNVYHAYATNSGGDNIQHETSRDLVHWTKQPDAAPTLGAWVDPACTFAPGGSTDRCVWAPEVTAVGSSYVLYYAARDLASQRQCIGVSTATSPYGPFVPVGTTPLVCPVAQGGAIDASHLQGERPAVPAVEGGRQLLQPAGGHQPAATVRGRAHPDRAADAADHQ